MTIQDFENFFKNSKTPHEKEKYHLSVGDTNYDEMISIKVPNGEHELRYHFLKGNHGMTCISYKNDPSNILQVTYSGQ